MLSLLVYFGGEGRKKGWGNGGGIRANRSGKCFGFCLSRRGLLRIFLRLVPELGDVREKLLKIEVPIQALRLQHKAG